MNDKKPLVDFRSAPKLQTALMLSGALIGLFGTQGGITVLTVLGIVLILASCTVWSLYYRCPHCGEQLGRDRYLKYCPHCGRALDAPLDAPVRTLSVPACAKLNLTLDILGKRPDGYHEMKMVMQTISLHDDVVLTLTDGRGITCRVADAALPCEGLLRGRELFRRHRHCAHQAHPVRGWHGGRQRGRGGGAARAARSRLPRAHG